MMVSTQALVSSKSYTPLEVSEDGGVHVKSPPGKSMTKIRIVMGCLLLGGSLLLAGSLFASSRAAAATATNPLSSTANNPAEDKEEVPQMRIVWPQHAFSHADELADPWQRGEFTLTLPGNDNNNDAASQLYLSWYNYSAQVRIDQWTDRTLETVSILEGTTEALWGMGGYTHDMPMAVWPDTNASSYMWQLASSWPALDKDVFLQVMKQLRVATSEAEWLDYMPSDTFSRARGETAIQEFLQDVPVPDDFVMPRQATRIANSYQLAARTCSAVACAWIQQWLTARESGDQGAAAQATNAMQTSHQWKVLQDMQKQGDYSQILWEYADAMVQDPGSMTLDVVKQGLGC